MSEPGVNAGPNTASRQRGINAPHDIGSERLSKREYGPMTRDTRPLEKMLSPEEAAASWNERKIYDPLVDGYGPQLKLIRYAN